MLGRGPAWAKAVGQDAGTKSRAGPAESWVFQRARTQLAGGHPPARGQEA